MSISKLNSEGYYDLTAYAALTNICDARQYQDFGFDKGMNKRKTRPQMKNKYSCTARAQFELILINVPYDRADMMKVIKAAWNPRLKAYTLPLTKDSVKALLSVSGMQLDERLTYLAESVIIEPSAGEQMSSTAVMQMPVKATPFMHQIKAFNLGLQKPSVALLMEMGTGKTVTAIGIAGARYLRGEIKRVLVVCPVSVISVWLKELIEMADYPVDIIAPEGDSVKKGMEIKAHRFSTGEGCKFVIVNYETVWRTEVYAAINKYAPDMIIADESQRLKSPSSNQSKAMQTLGSRSSYNLILTGTPVMNSPLDFWGQYRFLNASIFDPSYFAFKSRHAFMGGFENRVIIGYRDLDVLVKKAHSAASRVTKAQALDLPETTDKVVPFRLEPRAMRLYTELNTEMIAELGALGKVTAPYVITKMLRLSQLTGGFITSDDGETISVSNAKLMALKEELEDILDSGRKVVIFARFRAEVKAILALAIKEAGSDAVRMIWGDTLMSDRGQHVKDFQENPAVKVFVAQIATAGLGITLTAASTAIFYSCDYSFGNHEQAKARIHRIGQRNACTYVYLVAEDTVDEAVLAALAAKKSLADLVVDNWKTLLKKGVTHD